MWGFVVFFCERGKQTYVGRHYWSALITVSNCVPAYNVNCVEVQAVYQKVVVWKAVHIFKFEWALV